MVLTKSIVYDVRTKKETVIERDEEPQTNFPKIPTPRDLAAEFDELITKLKNKGIIS